MVLKVEDNPLVFPPVEILSADEESSAATSERLMLHITMKIKKYLRQHANYANGRSRGQGDSDGELRYATAVSTNHLCELIKDSEAETPRPARPFGNRFPVRPSQSGIDTIVIAPSTSPEPAPPIPIKSHERMKSVQTQPQAQPQTQPVKNSLLSPPDLIGLSDRSALENSTGNDGPTIRPKRHGMVTPRGPEGAAQALALSPSALQEAFSNMSSRSHSRAGSNVSTASIATESILETSKLIYTIANDLSKKLNGMRPILEWQSQAQLKTQVELDLRSGASRIDILGRYLRRAQQESSQPSAQRPSYLLRPVIDCLSSISQFSRSLSQCSGSFCRASSYDTYKASFWEVQKETWDMYVANARMSDVIHLASHSRQTSTASQYRQAGYGETIRPTLVTAVFDTRYQQSRNGLIPSPTALTYSRPMHQSQSSSISTNFSPIVGASTGFTSTGPSLNPDGGYIDESRPELDNDLLWDSIFQSLQILCERANEGLPKIQMHYFGERQKALRIYDQDHETVRQLSSLVARSNNLVDVANRLTLKLDSVKLTDKSIRQSLEFWQLVRNMILVRHCKCGIIETED
jgi:hypothetical protein